MEYTYLAREQALWGALGWALCMRLLPCKGYTRDTATTRKRHYV